MGRLCGLAISQGGASVSAVAAHCTIALWCELVGFHDSRLPCASCCLSSSPTQAAILHPTDFSTQGKKRFDKALQQLEGRADIQVVYHPFIIDHGTAPGGGCQADGTGRLMCLHTATQTMAV